MKHTGDYELDRINMLEQECADLEEENKNLKKECEENDYLVEDNARWMKQCEEKIMEIKNLKMSLEEKDENCYSLARENEQLKLHIEAKDKAYMDLLTDYNYLKARIKKMERGYLKFHDNLKKLDDKLDDIIMNR